MATIGRRSRSSLIAVVLVLGACAPVSEPADLMGLWRSEPQAGGRERMLFLNVDYSARLAIGDGDDRRWSSWCRWDLYEGAIRLHGQPGPSVMPVLRYARKHIELDCGNETLVLSDTGRSHRVAEFHGR